MKVQIVKNSFNEKVKVVTKNSISGFMSKEDAFELQKLHYAKR